MAKSEQQIHKFIQTDSNPDVLARCFNSGAKTVVHGNGNNHSSMLDDVGQLWFIGCGL